MSSQTARSGRVIALWLLAAALVPAGSISIPSASAAQRKTTQPPTLLWKSYPLEQRPSATKQAQAGSSNRQGPPKQRPSATKQAQAGSDSRQGPPKQRPSGSKQAQAGSSSRQGPPKQRPSASKKAQGGSSSRQAAPQRLPDANTKQLRNTVLVSVLLAVLIAMTVVLLRRRLAPARSGGFRRTPDEASIRGLQRRFFRASPSRRTRPQPPPRQVPGEPIAEPRARSGQRDLPEPGDDLIEALHPRQPSSPEPEPVLRQAAREEPWRAPRRKHDGDPLVEERPAAQPKPVLTCNPPHETRGREPKHKRPPELPLELQLRRLVERVATASASQREQLEREIQLLHARIEARQPNGRGLERQGDHELRRVIDDVHAIPETSDEAEPPPQRRPTRQAQASVPSCEIKLWRGFTKCQLCVTLRGSEEAFAVSRYFRLPDQETPKGGAQRALSDLLAELERGGWTVVSDGAIWYQRQLQRLAPSRGNGETRPHP